MKREYVFAQAKAQTECRPHFFIWFIIRFFLGGCWALNYDRGNALTHFLRQETFLLSHFRATERGVLLSFG